MEKTFIEYKKIKRGFLTKNIKFKKLRDDISCNIEECVQCQFNNNFKILTLKQPIIFLSSKIILNEIDAIENFPLINNCILPLSEYNILLQLKGEKNKILKRFNRLIENRQFFIFPNEFHKEIADIQNEENLNKIQRNEIIFDKTIEFFINHIMSTSNDFELYVIVNDLKEILNKNIKNLNNLRFYDMISLAKEKMKQNPDLFNYISFHFSNNINDENKMQIDDNTKSDLTEGEMKSNIKQAKMFQGKIYFQPGILTSAIVKSLIFSKDILIEGTKNLNRTLNGDIVCFSLEDESKWKKKENENFLEDDENDTIEDEENLEKDIENNNFLNIKEKIEKSSLQPTGKIEGILQRNKIIFSGTIFNSNNLNINSIDKETEEYLKNINDENICIFIPIDNKYPNFLIKLYSKETYFNQRIIIKFDNWNNNLLLPSGHFIMKLGECLDIPVENNVILYEHNVDVNPFSKKIINNMPKEDIEFSCPKEELEKRYDLRDRNICSIDPPGCKDIDDALHCKILPNGNYELGVHIADVTYYVRPGDEVDRIAAKNCNTIYLVHKRTDMLPKVLTENLCSLVGGKERLAFSVLWEFDKDSLEVKNVVYGKSVIKSKAALTYEQANNIMNDDTNNTELAVSIRLLNKIAKVLKQRRIDAGALILASNEMKFNLNQETNTITDISMYKTYETNSLVEECMLLANVWVAKKIFESFPSCAILRRHPPPKEKELNNFVKILNERGYSINTNSSIELNKSLDKIKRAKDPFFNKLIRSLITRTMNQAKYFSSVEFSYEEFFHYGLAMEIYTHFTSPIRRYCDILVHRLLAAALDIDYLPTEMTNKVKNNKECNQMNRQNRVGFFCGKDSNYFSAFIFFKENEKERKSIEIVVHSIDKNFVKGISVKFGIEANLDFVKIKNGVKIVDEEKKIVVLGNGDEISLFDHVNVEIETVVFNYRYEIKYHYLNKINL